ncbi:DHHC palmitoyltransferase-domain-containing protein [Circinella umbellata]|nr:DHHC palmitoyltransferase-domain-containing protein [Circinella umbellata]
MLDSIPGRVFIVGVSLLIATIAYSSQIFIFLPAMGWWSIKAAKSLIPFNLLVLMIYYNYYLACTTDPGPVPQGWEPPYSTLQPQEGLSAIDTGITGPRYCKTCKNYKPPRTHHCRYCRRCVLKMDHHCPWIANCVGHDNYPHFIRFIIYVDIACSYALGLLIWRVRVIMDEIRHFRVKPTTTEIVFLVLNFILAFVVLFCVGVLSAYHMYCITRNQSSVESWERSKVKTLIKRGKILPIKYPFDIGFYRNICTVLGNNPLLWLWPKQPTSDGLVFSVRSGTDPRLPYCWPPRDPDDLRPSIFSKRYKRQQDREIRKNRNRLVRRDSEGYLVREITLEERMGMLNESEQKQQIDEQYQQYSEQEHLEQLDGDEYDRRSIDSVEDYYDSGSCVSDDGEDTVPRPIHDDEEYQTRQQEHYQTRWMENSVFDLSGGGDEYYGSSGSSWESEDEGDNVPLMPLEQLQREQQHTPTQNHTNNHQHVQNKVEKED